MAIVRRASARSVARPSCPIALRLVGRFGGRGTHEPLLFGAFIVCSVSLGLSLLLLAALGTRLRVASRLLGVLVAGATYAAASWITTTVWGVTDWALWTGLVWCAVVAVAVIAWRGVWNAVGQVFMASFVAAALTYLVFAVRITVGGHLSPIGAVASLLLLVLECFALLLAGTFAFETCDVVCRVRHSRAFPVPDPTYLPKVSLHIAAYNEPPDMLIETIRRAEELDYPDFEIVVVDNNTGDRAIWEPVEEYCNSRPGVRFVHVAPWPGYKSGALNLALRQFTHPEAEIVGVIDSDYLVDAGWLRATVGYFADPKMAFVQTPQDYRDWEGNAYLTACYDAYRYFFATSMPSRNERNSIIFAGTMGLLRRSLLSSIEGWDEWCITEDADTSLRLLRAGYSGLFLARSFGRGIMPLTFSSLKSQRFRWCFGGMQILRTHWRSLLPWDRSGDNHLSVAQRIDYLVGGLQWMNDLAYLCFTLVLLVVAGLLLAGSTVAIRPLVGPTVLLPAMLLGTGLLRAVWALRQRVGITYKRACLAFVSWLSLSWTVALACVQGLLRREGVFLRTPKSESHGSVLDAALAARTETTLWLVLWGAAVALGVTRNPTALLVGLLVWQGAVYASSPYMSWLAQHSPLTPELERRRRSEQARERLAAWAPIVTGTAVAGTAVAAAALVLFGVGASHAGHPSNPFVVPPSSGANPTTTTTSTVPTTSSTTTSVPGSTTTNGTGSTTTISVPGTTTTGATSTTSSTTTSTTGPGTTTVP